MSRSPLPYVPLDCVLEIASHVPTATRAAMACVCNDWARAFKGPSIAWRTLNLSRLPPLQSGALPPPLAARLPAVRALTLGVPPPRSAAADHDARPPVAPVHAADAAPLLRAASGLTSLHVTVLPADVAPVAAAAAAACPGLAALALTVADVDGESHGLFQDWAILEPLTALTRLSRLRVAFAHRDWLVVGGQVQRLSSLPHLPALRAVVLQLHRQVWDTQFGVCSWLASNTQLESLDVCSGRDPPARVPDSVTRLRVAGPDPTGGLEPWLRRMTRLVDLEWDCGPDRSWARTRPDTVDAHGRLEACAPHLTRLALANWPSHAVRLQPEPMPRLRMLQFRGFKPRLHSLALPPIAAAAPALRVLVVGLSSDVPAERRVVDLSSLLVDGLPQLRMLVLEHAAVTASRPARVGDAARRAFPCLRSVHLHACTAAHVRGEQVMAALREVAERTCTGACPLETPQGDA